MSGAMVAACMSSSSSSNSHNQTLTTSTSTNIRTTRRRRRPLLHLSISKSKSKCVPMAIATQPSSTEATLTNSNNRTKPFTKQRRVVVTGMGVETPIGNTPDDFYDNLLNGVSGISQIEAFDCSNYPTRIAGEIKNFSTNGWVAPKLSKRMDRFMLYMLTAGKKALADAGIDQHQMDQLDKTKCGVLIGSAMGGMKVFNDAIEALRVSYRKMNPFCVPFATTNMGSAMLAMDLGWMGPNYSISTACATSNFCILNAANHIIRGEADWEDLLHAELYLRETVTLPKHPTHGIRAVMDLLWGKELESCCWKNSSMLRLYGHVGFIQILILKIQKKAWTQRCWLAQRKKNWMLRWLYLIHSGLEITTRQYYLRLSNSRCRLFSAMIKQWSEREEKQWKMKEGGLTIYPDLMIDLHLTVASICVLVTF